MQVLPLFQSTPPVKAATFAVAVNYIFRWIISIHAAREGGDVTLNRVRSISGISIHAAREGGDPCDYHELICMEFQSTPPVKAATIERGKVTFVQGFQSTPPVKAAT